MAEHTTPFDLVALDLDGTVLDTRFEGGFSQNVVETIAAVQAAGVPVTIASGRTLDYIRRCVPRLGITTPVVSTQGAVVGDALTGDVLHETLIPVEMVSAVIDWITDADRVAVLYFSDHRGGTVMIQNREEWEPHVYDHWFGTPRTLRSSLSGLLEEIAPLSLIKFITVNDMAVEADLTPSLQAHFGTGLHITRTHTLLVEGTAPGVDKGAGLLHLLDHLAVSPARVLAIGDNENDIPMLQIAGVGVAMGQATDKVKAVANWIAPPIEEDGAAVAMQRFVLDRL